MGINKLVFAALTAGCLAAAGIGGFLAVRLGQPEPTAAAPVSEVPGTPAAVPPGAVTESEGVITPTPDEPAATAETPSARDASPEPRATTPARSRPPRAAAPARPTPAPAPRVAEVTPPPTSRPAPVVEPTPSPAPAPVQDNTGSMWEARASIEPEVPSYAEEPPPPPAPEFVDVEVPADSVLGLQVERTISSENARVEDRVTARVTRDVRVGGRVAIPAGAIVTGSVTDVDRGGKMKGKARLAVRFHTVTLADGTQFDIRTEPVVREGQSAGRETAAKVGGAAIGGAILGAILGGGRGAAIGAGVGAAGGTAASMANDRNPASLPAGTTVTVRVQQPVTVTVQKE